MKEELVEVIFYERIDGHIFTKLPTEVFKNDLELNDMQVIKISQFIQGWRPKLL